MPKDDILASCKNCHHRLICFQYRGVSDNLFAALFLEKRGDNYIHRDIAPIFQAVAGLCVHYETDEEEGDA